MLVEFSLLRLVMSSRRRTAPSPCTWTVIGVTSCPSMSRLESLTPLAESLIQTEPRRSARVPGALIKVTLPVETVTLPT